MRLPLDKQLRSQLETAVEKARDIAELAAKEELDRLGVSEKQAPDYLSPEQREQRNRLRAHGRFLGDIRRASGEQEVALLITEIAYEHWHRMLFSRFLAENDLLMYEDGVTALAISDCFDLAEEETGDSSKGWQYAANYASKMLPQIFRNDSPALELEFSPNHQKKLEQLLEGLDEDIFQAQDSLGWVYQFWQSKRKDEVNKSEVKIGAKELSPVTQLFTEPYMVSFLLDNALGAWWANQQLTDQDYATASTEQELRDKAAIDGVPLEYLRFVRTFTQEQKVLIDNTEGDGENIEKPDPAGPWEPAAGKFEQWPENLSEFKTLDPCCGSGHFLVAVFLMLVPIRMQREGSTEKQAIDAVLTENIHALELDQRCIEIAVFALALEAWRYPNGGGFRQLPELHLACSGLSVKAAKNEWKQLGLGKKNLTIALDWMHKEFSDSPVLGSLVDPAKSSAASIVGWDELSETLNNALEQEMQKEHHSEGEQQSLEATVAAQGLAKTAMMLAGKYHWIVTNVPYLGIRRQSEKLKAFVTERHELAKGDLATTFMDRFLFNALSPGGRYSVVTPSAFLSKSYFSSFREKVLTFSSVSTVTSLGVGAFDTITGEVVDVILLDVLNDKPSDNQKVKFLDASVSKLYAEKPLLLKKQPVKVSLQKNQLGNPSFKIQEASFSKDKLLIDFCECPQGIKTGDDEKWLINYWEFPDPNSNWDYLQSGPSVSSHFSGFQKLINWSTSGLGMIRPRLDSLALGKVAVGITQTGNRKVTIYNKTRFDSNIAPIVPTDPENLLPIYSFCTSSTFEKLVADNNRGLYTTNTALMEVPFDLKFWKVVADSEYPYGLPDPYSNSIIQWIFHGHPAGSVIWDEKSKSTVISDLRTDDTVLQAAIARLLGYQWPAELDLEMELSKEQRACVNECKKLLPFADDDGIVCLPAVRGEKAADQRLEELLQASYGETWSTQTRNHLLESVGCKNKSFSFWLQEKFFEQHCKLFQHRPFIWHIWDGLKDGFSALVNYHQLDKKNLERLIYTYLDDWIRTQSHQQSEGIDGANERLVAAQNLKQSLELILEGEAPYDIFVRWKPLEEQSVGWNPDLNDGVRLNIRPFMTAGVLRHNKKPKLNVHWNKDRGKDVASAPWYQLGLEYGGKEGDRINDHHLSLVEKQNTKA